MSRFSSVGAPYRCRRRGRKLLIENEFTRWVHDPECGGELVEAVVRHGSGKNLLAGPQRTVIGIREQGRYHLYASTARPAETFTFDEQDDVVSLVFTQRLYDGEGRALAGVALTHRVSYHPFGYGMHVVDLATKGRLCEVGQIQVGAFHARPVFDRCAMRESSAATGYLAGQNGVSHWRPLHSGHGPDDTPVFCRNHLPLSVLLFRRGVEGLEFSLGDELGAWDGIGRERPGWQQAYLAYDRARDAYEVRFCPLDANFPGQHLEGTHRFAFRMALPHVRPSLVPLRPCAGSFLQFGRPFAERWPTVADLAGWRKAGATVMRLHDDGDHYGNGIFWRDAAYPPYPPAEMAAMAAALGRAAKAGISMTPYFSVKEFHPEAAGFAKNAPAWMRLVEPQGDMICNYSRHNIFGAQMCLKSGWGKRRTETIEEVLARHPFRGVYYDWCCGYECCHPGHMSRGMRHWDQDELQQLLEWSWRRVGPDGEVYLHLTHVPNLAAENLATLVITEESSFPRLGPEMFTPHVHFMNIVPRQICDMLGAKATDRDRRQLAMAAFLHHATVSSTAKAYREFYAALPVVDFSSFQRHAAPGEGVGFASGQAGISVCWNKNRAAVFLANFSKGETPVSWQLDGPRMGQEWAAAGRLGGKATLGPLALKCVRLDRVRLAGRKGRA